MPSTILTELCNNSMSKHAECPQSPLWGSLLGGFHLEATPLEGLTFETTAH